MTDMSDLDTGDNLYHVRKSRLIRLINWWQVSRKKVLYTQKKKRAREREGCDGEEPLFRRDEHATTLFPTLT